MDPTSILTFGGKAGKGLGRFIDGPASEIFLSLGSLILGSTNLIDSKAETLFWISLTVGTLFVALGIWLAIKRKGSVDELNSKIQQLEGEKFSLVQKIGSLEYSKDYFEYMDFQLGIIFEDFLELQFNSRISIYKHDKSKFIHLGRYSSNPHFREKGRGIYPDSEGLITKAWREGSVFVPNLPDPAVDIEAYYNSVSTIFPVGKEVIESLKMKSRCYLIFRIDDPTDKKPKAVVVVESMDPIALDENRVKDVLSDEGDRLLWFITKLKYIEPSSSYSAERGL